MKRRKRSVIEEDIQTRFDLEYASNAIDSAAQTDYGVFNDRVLEGAVNSIELPPNNPELEYDNIIVKVEDKLRVNCLGPLVQRIIRKEAANSTVVEQFIRDRAKQTNDEEFPKKLRSFFFNEYKRLLMPEEGDGLFGDLLFIGVRDAVAERIRNESAKKAAILVHLFLICDLFERPKQDAVAE